MLIDAFNMLLHWHNLGKFLSKLDGDRFCLICFCNFQTDRKLKQRDYIEPEMPKKFETALNPQTDKNERVPENVSKYQHYHISLCKNQLWL